MLGKLRKAAGFVRYRLPHLIEAAQKRWKGQDYFFDNVLQASKKRVRQFADNVEFGSRVLDIGTGTGVLAGLAVKKGATRVVAIDINPAAVEAARKAVPQADVFLSDLFSNVSEQFDTMVFSAPWSEGEIKREVHRAVFDRGVTARFLREAPAHLAPGGAIWLQYCDGSPRLFAELKDTLAKLDYSIEGTWSYRTHDVFAGGDSNIILYKLVPAGRS
jgi:methylase of polypeptide subunit release factors